LEKPKTQAIRAEQLRNNDGAHAINRHFVQLLADAAVSRRFLSKINCLKM